MTAFVNSGVCQSIEQLDLIKILKFTIIKILPPKSQTEINISSANETLWNVNEDYNSFLLCLLKTPHSVT